MFAKPFPKLLSINFRELQRSDSYAKIHFQFCRRRSTNGRKISGIFQLLCISLDGDC